MGLLPRRRQKLASLRGEGMKLTGKLGILPLIGLVGFFVSDILWDKLVENQLNDFERRIQQLERPRGVVIGGMEYEVFTFQTNYIYRMSPSGALETNTP